MRHLPVAGIATVLVFAACSNADRGRLTPSGPQYDHVQDLIGTPDLIVDAKRLADSWVVYDETFSATTCSVIEGGVQAGQHRAVGFTGTTRNIGNAAVFLGT